MADHMEELGIVIRADGTVELANGMKLTGEQISGVGKKLDEHGQKLQQAERGQKATTRSTREMGQAALEGSRHIGALGRELANGDWRGAAGQMAQLGVANRAFLAPLVGAGALVGGVAVAVGALAVAAYQGYEQQQRLNDSLLLTGNYAGLVTGQLDSMAQSVSRNIGGTVGSSRQVLGGLVATGRFTAASLQEVASAAQLVAQFSGRTADQVVRDFTGMAEGVAQWAAKANRSYHFLSIEQWKHIKLLEDQGRKQEAMRETAEALARSLGGNLTTNLGSLERAWQGVKNWASSAWDAMMGIGRAETTEQKIETLTQRIDVVRNSRKGRYTQDQKDTIVAQLEAERSALQSDLRQARRLTTGTSDRAVANETAITAAAEDAKKRPPKGPSDGYERLNDQIERRLMLARAEASEGDRLSAADRFRVDMLHQIAEAEGKLGTVKAGKLRGLVEETAAQLRQNEAKQLALQFANQERQARERATEAGYREAEGLAKGNKALQDEVQAIGASEQAVIALEGARISSAIAIKEEALARFQGLATYTREEDAIRAQIETLKERQGLLSDKSTRVAEKEIEEASDKRRKQEAKDAEQRDRTISESISEGLVNGFREGESVADLFLRELKAQFAKTVLQPTIEPLVKAGNSFIEELFKGISGGGGGGGFLSGLFGGAGTGAATGADMDLFYSSYASAHTGGIVGGPLASKRAHPGVFAGALRFHTGGIVGDEVPIIAKRKEGVFTQEQMAALQPVGAGGTTITYAPQIQIDARSDRAEVQMLVSRAVRAGHAELLDKMSRREV